MDQNFDLQGYMTKGVERVVADAVKATVRNPKESAFMLRFAAASRAASKRRAAAEKNGEHVPPFLIASITSKCNLHCAGCYSRCNHATVDSEPVAQLTGEEWLRIFGKADEMGISFILLAGGEPMLRRDIIEAAGERRNILFPIFTNGTFIDEKYLALFDRCRNLIPIMSIEGNREITDARRGKGVYDRLIANMDAFQSRGLIFGASVTVTTENLKEVSSDSFIESLSGRGCRAVIFVEFVPVTEESRELAPGDAEREYLADEIARLRGQYPEMVFISLPSNVYDTTLAMYEIVKNGGLPVGINFDSKNRRPSNTYEDMFHAFILGMDSFAFGLIKAAQIIEDGRIEGFTEKKYESFNTELGQKIRKGEATLEELAAHAADLKAPKVPASGRQEYLEGVLNNIILS